MFYLGPRNAATEAVRQELKFVGQESGKLLAVRELLRKVSFYSFLGLEESFVSQNVFIIWYFTSIQTQKLRFDNHLYYNDATCPSRRVCAHQY